MGVRLRPLTFVAFILLTAATPSWSQALQSFEDLAFRVHIGDQLRVEDRAGGVATGRLIRLTADAITIESHAGEQRFTRAIVREISLRRHPIRLAALIGAGAGAGVGAWSECRGGPHAECPEGLIMWSALGAGVGAVVGTLAHTTTVVYSDRERRTVVLPVIAPGIMGVQVNRRW